MNKARQDILNMNDDQLNNMFNMMKNMDNATFKNMMKMQGMDISDDQLNMVKNSMNPDMFRMMSKNSDKLDNIPTPTKNTSLDNETQPTTQKTTPQQPFSIPQNMDMSSMMSFIQNNPQLLNMMGPQFSQMFGNNDPHMMKAIQNIMWLMSIPQRIKTFFSTTNGKMFILVIIVLIIAYFYR
jgi:hypothetical protein